jgi:hypothetical protein
LFICGISKLFISFFCSGNFSSVLLVVIFPF